jgi:putative sigma-54 modulation protein
MNINIKATNTTLTDGIRASIEDKLSVLEKFLRSEDVVYVEVDEDTRHTSGQFHRAEIRIQPHGHYAEARGNDFYEALDLVIPKIREQLTKEKDKRISLRRRLGSFFKRNR